MNDLDEIFIQTFGRKPGMGIGIESKRHAGLVINLERKLFLFEGRLDDFPEASPPCFDVATTEECIGDGWVMGT